jgi:hypothetical protein
MAKPAPVIDRRTSLLAPEKNRAFSFTPAATGSPTLWEAFGLPTGLSINASTGQITGTPTVDGVFQFVLRATNYDSRTFTVDTSTDVCTSNGHPFTDGDLVTVSSTTTLPSPLLVSTLYEIRDATASTFKLAATAGGPAIDLTTTGTGTHTMSLPQSDEMTVTMPVLGTSSVVPTNDVAIEINVDIVTGRLTVLGIPDDFEWGPPLAAPPASLLRKAKLLVKAGTRRPALIGFTRDEILQDLVIETLDVMAREYGTEPVISLNDGVFEKEGTGSLTRYRVILDLDAEQWGALLASYESDTGGYHDPIAEIRYTIGTPPDLYDETDTTTGIALEGGLSGGSVIEETASFTGMDEFAAPVPMELTITLTVAGRPLQSAELVRTFDLEFDAGAFVITNEAGDTTLQGPVESAKWRATLTHIDTTGDADSIDVDVEIETTNDASYPYYEWVFNFDGIGGFSGSFTNPEEGIIFADTLYLSLYDASDTQIGSSVALDTSFDDFADFIAELEAAWQTASGASDVYDIVFELDDAVRFRILSSTSVRGLAIAPSSPTLAPADITPGITGDATTATLEVRLRQVADPWVVPFDLASETFVLRAMDAMTPP